jgi:amidase
MVRHDRGNCRLRRISARGLMPDELPFLDIAELARRLRGRDISPVELTQALLERIGTIDVALHSYTCVTADLALSQARSAEAEIARGHWRGPLHGIPVALKDLFWTRGIPTTAGMPIHADFRPAQDATVVRRLAAAGAVLLGKLKLTEGAVGEHHPAIEPPLNPWDTEAWPGASSSGSGVAVAAGLCFAAMGSDTGGSIRFPSVANGVTGLKPTWGRVSRHGVFALSELLDCMGPLTRSVADTAAMLAVIAGPDPLDPTASHEPVPDYLDSMTTGARGLKIAIDPALLAEVDPFTASMIEAALQTFASLGVSIHQKRLRGFDEAVRAWWPLCSAGAALAHAETFPSRAAEYGPSLRRAVEHGRSLSAIDLLPALVERERFRATVAAFFGDVDLLLLPVQAFAGPSLQQMKKFAEAPDWRERMLRFVAPFALTGQPALVLPGGATPEGLPIGFQLVAMPMREPLLLRAGHAFQLETAWHRRRPPLATMPAADGLRSHAR